MCKALLSSRGHAANQLMMIMPTQRNKPCAPVAKLESLTHVAF